MPNIKLSELSPAGSELFHDSENFLNELSAEEVGEVIGGNITDTNIIIPSVASQSNGTIASVASLSGGQISVSVGATIVQIINF